MSTKPASRGFLALLLVSAAVQGCTTARWPPVQQTDDRISVYMSVMNQVLRQRAADLAVIDPRPLTAYYCGCQSGRLEFIAHEISAVQPDTLRAFCDAPPPLPLSETQLRQLGKPGPFQSALGRVTTPLSFSAVGFDQSRHQALVCVKELDDGKYYLLTLRNGSWAVQASTFAIIW